MRLRRAGRSSSSRVGRWCRSLLPRRRRACRAAWAVTATSAGSEHHAYAGPRGDVCTSVMVWRDTNSAAGQRTYEGLSASIESLRGSSRKRFTASVTVLKPVQGAGSSTGDLWLVNFSERASQSYLVLRQARQAIEASRTVAAILSQTNTHQPRISLAVDGQQYQLGDFAVRVGNVTVRANGEPRGTIVQVDYKASSNPECATLLQEFTTMLREATATASGRLEAVQVPLQEFSLPPGFCHQHLAVQYTSMVQRLLVG